MSRMGSGRTVQNQMIDALEPRRLLSTAYVGVPTRIDTTGAQSTTVSFAPRPGGFIASWRRGIGVVRQRFTDAGMPVGKEFANHDAIWSIERIASDQSGNHVAVWAEGTSRIAYRLFNADGTPRTNRMVVREGDSPDERNPSVAMTSDGRFVIAWTDFREKRVLLQRFTSAGAAIGQPIQLNTTSGFDMAPGPDVHISADGNSVGVSWLQKNLTTFIDELHAIRFDGAGNSILSDTIISSPAVGIGGSASALADNGNFLVTWDTYRPDSSLEHKNFVRAIGPAGAIAQPIQIGSVFGPYEIDFDGQTGVVIGNGLASNGSHSVIAQRLSSTGSRLGARFSASALLSAGFYSSDAVLVVGDRFIVGWTSDTFGSRKTYFQAFDQSGTAGPVSLGSARLDLEANISPTARGQRIELNFSSGIPIYGWDDFALSNETAGIPLTKRVSTGTPASAPTQFFLSQLSSKGIAVPFTDGNLHVHVARFDLGDALGNPLAADIDVDFFALDGDLNRDRFVGFEDQVILSSHFGQSGGYLDGDLNYDGTISTADQTILSSQMNRWLPPQGSVDLPASNGPDEYRLLASPTPGLLDVYYNIATHPSYRLYMGALRGAVLNFLGGGADDALTLDQGNGPLVPANASIHYDGGAGNDTFNVLGTAGGDNVTFSESGMSFGAITNAYENIERVTFDGAGGFDNLGVSDGPAVIFAATQRFNTLSILAASVALDRGLGLGVVVKALSIGAGGTLDLNDNDMIVDYAKSSVIDAVQEQINLARAGGAWTGAGITSSAARNATPRITTLGAMEASDWKALPGNATALFANEAVDQTAVLIKYTYYGDTNFDGRVNFDDYARIDAGFNNRRTGWINGDFNGSGVINFDDYTLIDLAFNQHGVIL